MDQSISSSLECKNPLSRSAEMSHSENHTLRILIKTSQLFVLFLVVFRLFRLHTYMQRLFYIFFSSFASEFILGKHMESAAIYERIDCVMDSPHAESRQTDDAQRI